ncbi:unnamed protein product [Alternaria alternata]
MAASSSSDYGPSSLSDEDKQQLEGLRQLHHDRGWFDSIASPAFHRATTSQTQQPPCEYIDGVPLDWSGHGTSHVDYNKSDVLPLSQGKFLGHGMQGGVYETNCNGVKLAWKRKYCRRKIGERERREIEVIKKLSHRHIIRLMGTYTHGPFLGLLLWPVATCDLATLLEDVDWLQKRVQLEEGMPLKFVTDNGERGTPKYFAPEVASFEPSGRAADVFSMGCIFFEILILCSGRTLEFSTLLRRSNDKSFQSNLETVELWLVERYRKVPDDVADIDEYLLDLVRSMMDAEAHKRPTAGMVEQDIAMRSGLAWSKCALCVSGKASMEIVATKRYSAA